MDSPTESGAEKRLQAEVEGLRARMQEEREGTHAFVAMMAHELRTPIGAILMWAHVLRMGRPDDREAALNAIETSARAQSDMIGRLLEVTRAMARRLRVEAVLVDLVGPVRSAVEEMKSAVTAAAVRLKVSVMPGPIMVRGDALRLKDMVVSLLKHAVQVTPVGGTVAVEAAQGDGVVRVVVRDTGPRLSVEEATHLFTPFRLAGEPLNQHRGRGGLGLDLPFVGLLAELHGGTVTANSPPSGPGCAITLQIPLARLP